MNKIILGIIGFCFFSANLYGWTGPIDSSTWNELKGQVIEKQAELDVLFARAEAESLDVERAYAAKLTLSEFLIAAQWDYDNPALVLQEYQKWPFHLNAEPEDHLRLPFEELSDCLAVADYAINELTKQLSGEIRLKSTPNLHEAEKVRTGPNFRQNGKIVFPISYNFLPATDEYRRAYGGFGGNFHFLSHLKDDLTVNRGRLNGIVDRINDNNSRFYTPIVHFHGHSTPLPSWMVDGGFGIEKTNNNPVIYNGGRNFVTYDISNPNIKSWQRSLLQDLVPRMADTNSGQPIIHMLANEPQFALKTRGWRVREGGFTEDMRSGYRRWLEAKYETIENLNESHGSSWANFGSIDPPFPLDVDSLQGTAQYYDVCRWNMDRVNSYFKLMADEIKAADPEALIHIKLLGGTLIRGSRDDGMDFEFLTKLMDVTGCDAETTPSSATFYRNAPDREASDSWLANYSIYWTEQLQFIDYGKSIKSYAPHYNSEWHGLSTVSWRDFNMERKYVRASLWMAFTHGLNQLQTWGWGRNMDGSISDRVSFVGAANTQPIVIDEHARTAKEVNAHAYRINRLARKDRFAYIYRSEAAAIQDSKYGPNEEHVYEALKLLNYSVGMTSVSLIQRVDPAMDFIVVPPSEHLPYSEINALNRFKNAGGRVIVFEDGAAFGSKTELGVSRSNVSFTPNHTLDFVSPAEMAVALKPLTEDLAPKEKMICNIFDTEGISRFGVLFQQYYNSENGETTAFLVNVSNENRVVDLRFRSGASSMKLTNLITNQEVSPSHMLEPMDILFLKAESSSMKERSFNLDIQSHDYEDSNTVKSDDVTSPAPDGVSEFRRLGAQWNYHSSLNMGSSTNLVDQDGSPSSVQFTITQVTPSTISAHRRTNTQLAGEEEAAVDDVLRDGFFGTGDAGVMATISGLDSSGLTSYDLYVFSSAFFGGKWSTNTVTDASGNTEQTVRSPKYKEGLPVEGLQYSKFANLKPGANGEITVQVKPFSTGDAYYFNGLQLIEKRDPVRELNSFWKRSSGSIQLEIAPLAGVNPKERFRLMSSTSLTSQSWSEVSALNELQLDGEEGTIIDLSSIRPLDPSLPNSPKGFLRIERVR